MGLNGDGEARSVIDREVYVHVAARP